MTEVVTPESAVIVSLLTAILVGLYRTWRETGSVGFVQLPWVLIRKLVLVIRRAYFTYPKPEDTVRVDISKSELVDLLTDDHFESGWYVSFYYEGEDANLRRPQGVAASGNRQRHVRVWEVDGETSEFEGHDEMSPIQNPKEHLLGKNKRSAEDEILEEFDIEEVD